VFSVKFFRFYITTMYVIIPIAAHVNVQTNATVICTDGHLIVRSNSQKREY
jgi:hypothetical protein